MPEKTTKSGRTYELDGRRFTWYPLDDDDQPGNLEPVTIPLRIKFGLVRDLVGQGLDAQGMFDFLNRLIPDQSAALDEMDLNDFQDMFATWQAEYEALSGATLGESGASSV
jgi:hypothetical protein